MKPSWLVAVARIAGLLVLFGMERAGAHEFWVEPTKFSLERGGPIGLRLCVGDGFEGWSLARNARRIEKFAALGPSGELPVLGLDGSEPAGLVRLAASGAWIVLYRSDRAYTELPAAEFDRYLADKGLERIIALRAKRGADRGKVREAYSRHAKALIRVGAAGTPVFDRPIGLGLELIAESDRIFRLLYDGKPLMGTLVKATRPGTSDADLTARTGSDGRVSFNLQASGMWRIAAVHMIEAPAGVAADWESLWASLTFEMTAGAGDRAVTGACRNKLAPSAMQTRR